MGFIGKNSKIILDIEEYLVKNDGNINFNIKGYLLDFIKVFYNMVDDNLSSSYSIENLINKSISSLNFAYKRENSKCNVEILPSKKELFGLEDDFIVINIVNNNRPFIVDSITEALMRCGCTINELYNPIIYNKRNNDNEIIDIKFEHQEKEDDYIAESLLHITLYDKYSTNLVNKIHKEIQNTMSMVEYTVNDWNEMSEKVSNVIDGIKNNIANIAKYVNDDCEEVINFLQWLSNHNYIFMGYAKYNYIDNNNNETIQIDKNSKLGIFKASDDLFSSNGLNKLNFDAYYEITSDKLIEITKSNQVSWVHRPVAMDYIGIRIIDNSTGKLIGEHRFIGLFTSVVYYQSVKTIPLLRKKLDFVLSKSRFVKNGYSEKELVSVIEALPRDEILQIDNDELFNNAITITQLSITRKIKAILRKDTFGRFIACLIYLPKENFNTGVRRQIEKILLKHLCSSEIINVNSQLSDLAMARVYVIVKIDSNHYPDYDEKLIEEDIIAVATAWEEKLKNYLMEKETYHYANEIFMKYSKIFPDSYKVTFNYKNAFHDINNIIKLITFKESILFDLYQLKTDVNKFNLRIYVKNNQISLSDIMPILMNMGLIIANEHIYHLKVSNDDKIMLCHFLIEGEKKDSKFKLEDLKENFEVSINKIWFHKMTNDVLNKLIFSANIDWYNIVLIRAYVSYLKQINYIYDKDCIIQVFLDNPEVIKLIIKLFYCKFDPKAQIDSRAEVIDSIKEEIFTLLNDMKNVNADQVIKTFVELIDATLRTNFFQEGKDYISFKIFPKLISNIPKPVPFVEIFVYSNYMEGVHLRGGKVARGGLRWSDRNEDFRTEILGLMKAQMTKNSVIVPVGSKGGFIVKMTSNSKQEFHQNGIFCYKTLLKGMLDITDNLVDNKVIPPVDVIRYDEDDPYLVVAADKGTSSFSDIANEVSEEYKFWLGDAFASGGSVGYDHKKMGITSRGAWESVKHHLGKLGIDVFKDEFTVAGIGDMGGDVFGNGMLYTDKIKLVAAFNHMHIFLDPKPNAKKSFEERKRIFNLDYSSWEDYNQDLLSQGGQIIVRSEKIVKLTPENQELLDYYQDEATPIEIIQAILKSKVDLLWNGGIGTYVKSSQESNSDASDRNNDNLRINGEMLRCKVVGEGGNLGFTQKGRIEYELKCKGYINTDSIDNSAGVNCSDHEVNIKIAVSLIDNISVEQRKDLLESMTEEVAKLVLQDNKIHSNIITIVKSNSIKEIEQHTNFINFLEKKGLLNRELEFLPSDETLKLRKLYSIGLTRPEISVLISYSKMYIYDKILSSDIVENDLFDNLFIHYFPKQLLDYKDLIIKNHSLKKNIIANIITNNLVNRLGSNFVSNIVNNNDVSEVAVIKSYIIINEIFDLDKVWKELDESNFSHEIQLDIILKIRKFLEHYIIYFINNNMYTNVNEAIALYKDKIIQLSNNIKDILSEKSLNNLTEYYNKYDSYGMSKEVNNIISVIESSFSLFDIIKISDSNSNFSLLEVGKIYYQLSSLLHIHEVYLIFNNLSNKGNNLDNISITILKSNLSSEILRLTNSILYNKNNSDDVIGIWRANNVRKLHNYNNLINDIELLGDDVNIQSIIILINEIKMLNI